VAEEPQQQSNKIDDYILVSPVATGKTTQVWEVMHEQSGQMFAMKMLLPEAMLDADEKALLKHEAKVAQQLEHPNLIRCHGVVIRKTECYLLLDLFKTPNLKIFTYSDRTGVQARLGRLIEGVCQGLGHMHDKGWIHKDIKPDNILLNRASEVRVIDFSLAVRKAGGLSMLMGGGNTKGAIRGTRTYLAPETIKKEASSLATDIYSFGVTLFECLTGTPPFKGDTPQDLLRKHIATPPPPPSLINSNVTPEMDRLILKMLAKKPKDRHQTMEEVLGEFRSLAPFKEEVLEGVPTAAQQAEQAAAAGGEIADAAAEAELQEIVQNRRDSRSDARIREILERAPHLEARFLELKRLQQEEVAKREAENKRRTESLRAEMNRSKLKTAKPGAAAAPPAAAPAQPAQQAPPPGYYPQQMPGYGMPYPQMPYGMQQPGMPPQGYPPGMPPQGYPQQGMPPGQYPPGPYPPGMPPQGYPPGMPPQGYPPGMPGYPPGPGQPQMPPGQWPPAGQVPSGGQQPARPAPAAPQPAAAPPRPAAKPPAPTPAEDLPLMTDLPDIE